MTWDDSNKLTLIWINDLLFFISTFCFRWLFFQTVLHVYSILIYYQNHSWMNCPKSLKLCYNIGNLKLRIGIITLNVLWIRFRIMSGIGQIWQRKHSLYQDGCRPCLLLCKLELSITRTNMFLSLQTIPLTISFCKSH
jgi:hypothetical protein